MKVRITFMYLCRDRTHFIVTKTAATNRSRTHIGTVIATIGSLPTSSQRRFWQRGDGQVSFAQSPLILFFEPQPFTRLFLDESIFLK